MQCEPVRSIDGDWDSKSSLHISQPWPLWPFRDTASLHVHLTLTSPCRTFVFVQLR